MSVTLPTFSPAAPHSFLNVGEYVLDSSTADQLTTLKIDSTLKPGGQSSYVVRADAHKNSAVPGQTDDKLAVYIVIRGNIEVFTTQEKIDLINRVATVLTATSGANIPRIERGER